MSSKLYGLCLFILSSCLFSSCIEKERRLYALADITFCQETVNKLQIDKNHTFIRQGFNPQEWENSYEILLIHVKSVLNPELEPLSFSVNLEFSDETIEAGAFSLYPSIQPGIFRFRITDYKTKLLNARNVGVIIKFLPQQKQVLSKQTVVSFESLRFE